MGLQPKLQRPEWWRTLNAGRELLDPGVFASYKDDLSWKDLSGLKLSKTRYYCSEYAKNDSRLTKENQRRLHEQRHNPLPPWHDYYSYRIIGPYNNVPLYQTVEWTPQRGRNDAIVLYFDTLKKSRTNP